MAQIKLLKIGSTGLNTEFDSATDDITLNSFTAGAGPVISSTGVDMNNTDIADIQDLVFANPATGTINQTAGNLTIDNIVGKDRDNAITAAGAILFPAGVTDTAGQLDSLRLPTIAGTPTATPTAGEGSTVWDSSNNKLYIWDGAAWDDQSSVQTANSVDNNYTAEVAITARQLVYISSAGKVSPADSDTEVTARVIGFATAAASASATVAVRSKGILSGFSSLTVGARYFLTASGAVTATPPSGSADALIQVGFAKSATEIDIQIVPLSIKAS